MSRQQRAYDAYREEIAFMGKVQRLEITYDWFPRAWLVPTDIRSNRYDVHVRTDHPNATDIVCVPVQESGNYLNYTKMNGEVVTIRESG